MSDGPLEALLDRLRAGDLRAAEGVVRAYEAPLRLIVRRRLSRQLRAKFDSLDVVQSVWARVLGDFRANGCRLASAAHLRNFLIRVARNCLIDRFRRHGPALRRERPLADAGARRAPAGQPRPSEVARANELWEALLASCPPEHHELLQLKRQGLPLAAIAARTGLHPDSVRRVIRQLARRLAFSTEQTA